MNRNPKLEEKVGQAGETCLIFDTHAHCDDAQFDEDRSEILENLYKSGIGNVVDVGAGLKSTARAVALAGKYPFVYAAAGVHPTETAGLTEQDFLWLGQQLEEEKVVAVGEIGLDYHWDSPREIQQYWFERQLFLAVKKDMPVIIHSRDAAEDTLSIIKKAYRQAQENKTPLTGVVHCFSYGVEMAREYVKMGFYLGVGGVLTFKNARKLREVVEQIPLVCPHQGNGGRGSYPCDNRECIAALPSVGGSIMASLGEPKNTIAILNKYNFVFQKKFGKNFLIDPRVLEKIVLAAGIEKDDLVIEIGPGIGTMTQYLCESARHVVAVEIDRNLIPILTGDTLKDYSNVTVINEDILKLDINRIIKEQNGGRPARVVANLPYYITTPIIMGLFEAHVPLLNVTVMVQKEVANRMQAEPGSKDYGALSLAVQ